MTRPADSGFTLIEALVAMAVLAVAAAGFVRATEGHIDTVAALEARAAGGWAADNRLAEARVPGTGTSDAHDLLRRDWRTSVQSRASDDPDIAALTVSATDGRVTASVRGFVDTAAPPPPALRAPAAVAPAAVALGVGR